MKVQHFRPRWLALIAVIGLLSSLLMGYLWLGGSKSESAWVKKYPLLSKRLAVEDHNDILIDFDPLRKEIRGYLNSTGISHSFYFEYLPSGVQIRDGEDNKTVGASLMKIPLVMDLYRTFETGRINLDDTVRISQQDIDKDPIYGVSSGITAGSELSYRKLAEKTLISSDNTASDIILKIVEKNLPENEWSINYLDLEIVQKENNRERFVLIGAREYASILKCLYLSCRLEIQHSHEILGYLAMSNNASRIPTGVPSNIKVANKIGSFSDQVQSDCAIIYLPKRPYLICMMLFTQNEGSDKYFKDVSKMIYNYVSTVNGIP